MIGVTSWLFMYYDARCGIIWGQSLVVMSLIALELG